MPVRLAPSPHDAERKRAARRVWWFGMFLIVFAALRFAFIVPGFMQELQTVPAA